jgi:hypothetical protein
MCYPRPYPRCSDCSTVRVLRRTKEFHAKPELDQQLALAEAKMQHAITPAGILESRNSGKPAAGLLADANQVRRDQSLKDMLIAKPKQVVLGEDASLLTEKQQVKNNKLIADYESLLEEATAERDATGLDAETYASNKSIFRELHEDDKKAMKHYRSAELKIQEIRRSLSLEDNETFEAVTTEVTPVITTQESERLAAEQEFKNAHLSMKALKVEEKVLLAEKAEIETAMEARKEVLAVSYNAKGYDKNGFNAEGWNRHGRNADGFDSEGYNTKGRDVRGYNKNGYDKDGFDETGFNARNLNAEGKSPNEEQEKVRSEIRAKKLEAQRVANQEELKAQHAEMERIFSKENLDKDGFNPAGYNTEGFNREGYNFRGFNKEGFNLRGYDISGFNRDGFDQKGYDRGGYDILGFDKNRRDRDGWDVNGFNGRQWRQ